MKRRMLNVECLLLNVEWRRPHSTFNIQHLTFNILLFLVFVAQAFANDLTVDKRTILPDDSLTITLSLQDAFAGAQDVNLPLRNLVIDGSPSVSSEFQWINGVSSRKKVFRWSAHPKGPGEAIVGPLVLQAPDGQRETLPAIAIQVIARPALTSNDPAALLREMLAIGRDPLFVTVDVDRPSVRTGEEVVVTWTLYNATSVQQWALGDLPKLDDFWVEEIDVRNQQPQQILLDGVPVQRLVIRRAALFPLHAGRLTVPPMAINAAVLQRRGRSDDLFGQFEGIVTEVHRQSPPRTIDVAPLPAPADVVGDVTLRCDPPLQRNGGPVAVNVTMSGRANLRSAPAPRFAGAIDGSVQVVDLGVAIDRREDAVSMTRRWEYLIFPAKSGGFMIPPIASRPDLRCAARTLTVSSAVPEPPPPALGEPVRFRPIAQLRQAAPWIGGVVLLVIVAAVARPAIARERQRKREGKRAAADVEAWLAGRGIDPAFLATETSDRGDAYRALRSIRDAVEHDRIHASEAKEEIEQRIADLVSTIVG